MDDAGERRMLQLQKWRREMVHAEEYLAKHIQYDDAEYSDGEVYAVLTNTYLPRIMNSESRNIRRS